MTIFVKFTKRLKYRLYFRWATTSPVRWYHRGNYVLVSKYTTSERVCDDVQAEILDALRKPYPSDELLGRTLVFTKGD